MAKQTCKIIGCYGYNVTMATRKIIGCYDYNVIMEMTKIIGCYDYNVTIATTKSFICLIFRDATQIHDGKTNLQNNWLIWLQCYNGNNKSNWLL